MYQSWILNQELDSGTNTSEINKLIKKISPFTVGYKLLGAGGGGFMLILAKDAKYSTMCTELFGPVITIYVYDDACKMARIGQGKGADHPTDIDKDCVTTLKDFACMVMNWLNDYSSPGALPQPEE